MSFWKFEVIIWMLMLPMAAYGDFGLNITVPNLAARVAAGVGQGIIPLVKANGTIQAANIENDNGAVVALTDTINKVVSPLNIFLEHIFLAVNDRRTNSEVIFGNLNELASRTRLSMDEAIASASGLENKTKQMLFTQVVGNVTELADNVDMVKVTFRKLSAAADQVKNSKEIITSDNVSSLITPDMTDSLISALQAVATNVNELASLTDTFLKEQNSAIYYRNLLSSSFNTQQRNYETTYISSIERAIIDVNNTISVLSTGFKTSVKQAYSPFMNEPQLGRQQSLYNVTIYLESLENSTMDFIQSTNQSFATFLNNVNKTLFNQSQNVVSMLNNAVKNLTIHSLPNDSPYADRCVQLYGSQLSLSPVSVGRLSQCSQGESSSSLALIQTVRTLLEQAKSTAIFSANGERVCQKKTGLCSDLFFSALSDLAQQTSTQLINAAAVVQGEVQVIERRIRLCALATTADIGDNVRTIVNSYDSCLQTGN